MDAINEIRFSVSSDATFVQFIAKVSNDKVSFFWLNGNKIEPWDAGPTGNAVLMNWYNEVIKTGNTSFYVPD